jgi:hypothetical protein
VMIDMDIPFTLSDLSIWLAATAIILLITSELLGSAQEYSSRLLINKTRMRFAAIGCGFAFLVTIILRFM